MIFYNVTCHMDQAIAEAWLGWMLETHIPEVMATGCFTEYKILKLLTQAHDDEGVNYAIQYSAPSLQDYERYRDQFAPALQQQTKAKYGEAVLAFRTVLELVAGS
jgi:hypothetical protein